MGQFFQVIEVSRPSTVTLRHTENGLEITVSRANMPTEHVSITVKHVIELILED